MPDILLKIISCPPAEAPAIAEKLTELNRDLSVVALCADLVESPIKLSLDISAEQLEGLRYLLDRRGIAYEIELPKSSDATAGRPPSVIATPSETGGSDTQTVQYIFADTAEVGEFSQAESMSGEDSARYGDKQNYRDAADPLSAENRILYWEHSSEHGFLASLWSTWKNVIFSPTDFFSGLPTSGGLGHAFIFALIAGFVYTILSVPAALSMVGEQSQALGAIEDFAGAFGMSDLVLAVDVGPADILRQTMASLVLMPIALFYILIFMAGIFHFVAAAINGRGAFEGTFKVAAYSLSVLAFAPVPMIGPLLIMIYGFVLTVIGIREIHGLSTGAAVAVTSAPAWLLFLAIATALSAAGMAVMI